MSYSTEQELWAGVLTNAIEDLNQSEAVKPHKYKGRYRMLNRRGAVKWFNDVENKETGSFLWICKVLNLDPEIVREKIMKGK